MVLSSIQAIGNTLFKTQFVSDEFSVGHKIANCILLPLHGFTGYKSYKIENKKLEVLSSSYPLSIVYQAMILIAFFSILRTRLYPYLKNSMRWYMITVATVTTARAGILFLNKVNTIYGNSNALKVVLEKNKGNKTRTEEQQKKDIDLATAIRNKLAKDIEFFKSFNARYETDPEDAKAWLRAEKASLTYTYPFFTAQSLIDDTDNLPKESKEDLADLSDYWAAYYSCSGYLDALDEFKPYLSEQVPIKERSLVDFFKSWHDPLST